MSKGRRQLFPKRFSSVGLLEAALRLGYAVDFFRDTGADLFCMKVQKGAAEPISFAHRRFPGLIRSALSFFEAQ